MKTIFDTLKAIILLIAGIILLSSQEGIAGKPNSLPRNGAVGFSIGDKGYLGTGSTSNALLKDFWEYNPATDSWTQKADFGGTARYWAVGFSIGTKGYIGTGYTNAGTWSQDFWEYNPTLNSWLKKADFPGRGRCCAAGFSIGSKGYIGTGYDNVSLNCKDFYEYNQSTNTWTQKADFQGNARYAAVGFSIGTKGYIGTGVDQVNGTNTWYKDFYEYDQVTNSWTQKTDVGGLIAFGTGLTINGKGYIGLGNRPGVGVLSEFWEFDPNSGTGGTWTRKADFGGKPRTSPAAFSIGTKGYVGTGYNAYLNPDEYYQDFWEYNQTTNVWTQKTNFGNKHQGHLKDAAIVETNKVNSQELIVYPNPSSSAFNFRMKTTGEQLVNIQIFDLTGRLVHEYKSLSPDNVMTIGDNLVTGVYVAVVTQGEYRKVIKITRVD